MAPSTRQSPLDLRFPVENAAHTAALRPRAGANHFSFDCGTGTKLSGILVSRSRQNRKEMMEKNWRTRWNEEIDLHVAIHECLDGCRLAFSFTLSTNLDISYSIDAEPGLRGPATSYCISNTSSRSYIQGYDCTSDRGRKA